MAVGDVQGLFDECIFAIVISARLLKAQALDIKEALEKQGAKVLPFAERINVENVTHIVSETSDFPGYADARIHMIPVVVPEWVTHSLIKGKEAGIRPYSPDPDLIFSSVNLSCADIPPGDKDAIIGAVLAMGGIETNALTKLTTHICALTLDHPKCQYVVDKNLKCKIVLPHWFDDCLKLGKRIDEAPYLLPDPEIFRKKPEDDLPMPACDGVKGATSPRPQTLPIPTDSSARQLTVFNRKRVMLSDDLELSTRTVKVIEDLILSGGGSMTSTVHNADMFVCHWREGRNYALASIAGIDVGNLCWLYHLIAHNEWTSPLRRLLHYPLPRGGIPGFEKFRITLSNYGGEARTYLENLVIMSGGEFTKSMKQDNTHLITARNSSEKCQAAQEWGIEMVNHLWIEESYAKCAPQKLTDPRYTHFPPRTNLGEIIGRTQFDVKILEEIYFSQDPTPSPDDPKTLARKSAIQDRIQKSHSRKKSNQDLHIDSQDEEATPSVKSAAPAPLPSRRSRTLPHLTTPARRMNSGKENDTPSTNGSRSAKDKAAARIQGLALDIALFQKENKRKGSIWGGERAANKIEKQRSLERTLSPTKNDDEADLSEDEDSRTRKRQRTGPPPAEIRLVLTSYKGWLSNSEKEHADTRKLRSHGVLITRDPRNCTHLAAPAMIRTKKFLCALASAPVVVSTDFVDACLKEKRPPDAEYFILQDSESERKYGVKLQESLARARANKHALLRRVLIYCTEAVPNAPETYKDIVEANGGMFGIYRGRPTIRRANPKEDNDPQEPIYLISGTTQAEKKLWPSFAKMAREGNMIPRIVGSEWLLDTAMAQEIKWDESYLLFQEG